MEASLRFAPTGIGSLPFHDPAEAVAVVRDYLQEIPHWPQLPALSPYEGFVLQFIGPLVDLGLVGVEPGRAPRFRVGDEDWPRKLEAFYDRYLEAQEGDPEALSFFGFRRGHAEGFHAFTSEFERSEGPRPEYVKGQLSGPVTLGFQLTGEGMRAAFYDESLRDLIVKNLEMNARWQARALKGLGRGVMLFVDDPGLYAYGQSATVALEREDVEDSLNQLYDAIHQEGALAGTHSCAGTEWSLLTGTRVDIISFDAYEYFPSILACVDAIASFVARGGTLAWGIVPTSAKLAGEDAESLARLLRSRLETLARKGVALDRLEEQSLITPSCGTGTLSTADCLKAYQLVNELSGMMRGA